MGSIILLDQITANKIAAGEVVERPASVVKELAENAVDAGAGRIDISIGEGGLEYIRVVDDGFGMPPEDAPLAVKRHATSKIADAEDLNHISTLGFRGEALPSIASVSRFRLATRPPGALAGTLVEVEGGRLLQVSECGCPPGTEVNVEGLFYNTPARLKFIRTIVAETARVADLVQRLAMAWPEIAFSLTVNGKEQLITSGNGKLLEVIHQIYGGQAGRQMLPVDWQGPLLRVKGFVSRPALARANRNMQSFFVNKRYIRSPLLSDALQTAYQTLLPRHRFPAAVLHVEIAPHLVDVNVHPAKREVRFAGERDVYRQFLSAVREALQSVQLAGEIKPSWSYAAVKRDYHQQYYAPGIFSGDEKHEVVAETAAAGALLPVESPAPKAGVLPVLRPVGQFSGSFIIAESDQGDLYIVDQHAAHERILYNIIKKDSESASLPVQQIIPETYELDAGCAESLCSSLKIFERLGLTFEFFGNNTIILRTLPLFFRGLLKQADIYDLLAAASSNRELPHIFEEAMKTMACKAAVKANHSLSKEEMSSLLDKLRETAQPYTCPHGRPTVLRFDAAALASHFRRR